MSTYLDSSALLKLYVVEPGSAQVQQLAREAERVLLTPVQVLELRLALRRSQQSGILDLTALEATLRNLEEDLLNGLFEMAEPDWELVWRDADALARAPASERSATPLDYLHVAIARMLEISLFVTGDPEQANLARECGLAAVLVAG